MRTKNNHDKLDISKKHKKYLRRINKVRESLGDKSFTKEDIEEFVLSAPKFYDDYTRENPWCSNKITREFFYAIAGKSLYNKNSYRDGKLLIEYYEFQNGTKIYGELTVDKVISMMYWWHCIGYIDHRLTINSDGSMKAIHKIYVHEGFTSFDSFREYKEKALYEIGMD